MLSKIFLCVLFLFLIANLYYFFTNKTYKKSRFRPSMFFQLFFNYLGITITFSILYYLFSLNSTIIELNNNPVDPTFWDILYFSAETLLTIGYGDYVPVGNIRFFAVLEGCIGVLLPSAYFLKAMNDKD